jgi:hypothetical protein
VRGFTFELVHGGSEQSFMRGEALHLRHECCLARSQPIQLHAQLAFVLAHAARLLLQLSLPTVQSTHLHAATHVSVSPMSARAPVSLHTPSECVLGGKRAHLVIELRLSRTERRHLLTQVALQGVQSRNLIAHLTLVSLQAA